jgi:hypothetical protein
MNTRGRGSAWRLLSAVVLLSLVFVMFPAPVLAQVPVSEGPAPEALLRDSLTQPATTGTLEVCKRLAGTAAPPAEPFTFSVSGQTAPLAVTAGSCATLANVTTGSVTVTEQPMTSWQVTAINFLNGTGTKDVSMATAVAYIAAGETTRVEFVNGAPTPTQPPAPCSAAEAERPASAQHILAFPEQEVGGTYKAGSSPRWTYYQYANGAVSMMVFGTPDYANAWQQSVAVDINGDGWDETVSAYRDGNGYLAARSDIWHYRYGGLTTQGTDTWVSNADRLKGDNVKWIDIAAGNLARHPNAALDPPAKRDVVIATRNDEGDLELILLNGSDDGGIGPSNGATIIGGDFTDPTDGRENVYHVSVATGDLNADGFDDDVVTAFKDGGNHLQVRRAPGAGSAWAPR